MNAAQFTDQASKALLDSSSLAEQYSHSPVLPVHLAFALLNPSQDESQDQQCAGHHSHDATSPLFRQVVARAHGDPQLLDRALMKILVRLPSQDPRPETVSVSPALAKVIRSATDLSKSQKDSFVTIDHLIQAVTQDSQVQRALADANITNLKLVDSAVEQVRGTKRVDSKTADTESENENLKKFTIDITALAREGKIDPIIGREEEIRCIIRILSRRTKNHPILIGEQGVGKTTIAEGLARRIANAEVPAPLAQCRLLSLDLGSLAVRSEYRSQFEQHMKGVLKEIEDSKDMIVLFVDDIHLLMGTGLSSEDGIGTVNLLKFMLARGQLHCMSATTLSEYRKYIEKDQVFDRQFQQVLVKEPSVSDTISILRGLKKKYEVHHAVIILDGAIVTAATLASCYLTGRRLPDSAIDLIDEAAAAVRVARESKPEGLDRLEGKLQQLQIEIHALEREQDEVSKMRLDVAKHEAANVNEELQLLRDKFESEKQRSKELQDAKILLDSLKAKRDEAERICNIQMAADLEYYAIPETKARIERLEADRAKADAERRAHKGEAGEALLADAVRPDQIKEIVARLTSIPIT